MHRKSQSTSALSVILSNDNPKIPNKPPRNRLLPSLSEGETVDSPSTPSRRTQGSRISHSRTRSDLGSLVAEHRLETRTPVASRRQPEVLPVSSRESIPESTRRPEQQPSVLRRGTKSGTEDDTSDNSDRGTTRPAQVVSTGVEGTLIRNGRKRSKEDVRAGPSRRTPRRDVATPKRSRDDGFKDLTLDRCPSLLLSLRTTPSDRLRVLRYIEREFAQACQDIDPLGTSVREFLSKRLHRPLLATFRAEAQYLLRLPQGDRATASSILDNLAGLDILLNVLQGILLIGLRDSMERGLDGDNSRGIGMALQEAWVVEALVDVLAWTQTFSSDSPPTNQILSTLFALLVKLPSTLAPFSAAGGYEAVAGLLKMAEKEVRVKAIEFLVYLGTLSADTPSNQSPEIGREDRREEEDVFAGAITIQLPSTPKRKIRDTEAGPSRAHGMQVSGRASSGASTASSASNATNPADIDLLRTPVVSEYGSDAEVWSQHRDTLLGQGSNDGKLSGGRREDFQFVKSKSSGALSSHGFYTPQQRSEKHHISRASTSGSSQGSQEDSATFRPAGPQSAMRRSSLSVRPSATQQRIPSLRSLARVEEELAVTPKKLVDMSPARLKADFQESEVRRDMCSTVKLHASSRPSSVLRSPKTPTAKRSLVGFSGSETGAGSSPARGLVRDSSRTHLHTSSSSKSTDPRLLIPSGKANIGLGFPGSRLGKPTPLQTTKERTGSAEYPVELAKDSRIRGLTAIRSGETEKRVTSSESSTTQNSERPGGVRKSQTSASLAVAVDDMREEDTGTMRRGGF